MIFRNKSSFSCQDHLDYLVIYFHLNPIKSLWICNKKYTIVQLLNGDCSIVFHAGNTYEEGEEIELPDFFALNESLNGIDNKVNLLKVFK